MRAMIISVCLVVPEEGDEQNDRQWDAKQPKNKSATEIHGFLHRLSWKFRTTSKAQESLKRRYGGNTGEVNAAIKAIAAENRIRYHHLWITD